MAVTEAGTRVKEAAAGSAIVRPWRPPSTGIAATGYGFVEVLMASPTLLAISTYLHIYNIYPVSSHPSGHQLGSPCYHSLVASSRVTG